MSGDFTNRIDWLTPTIAFSVWAAHFTILWAASIIFPDQPAARWIALAVTFVSFGALFWLWRWASRPGLFTIPGFGIALAAIGMIYDGLPALIG